MKITKTYIRRYRDNGQVTAYVEWSDGSRTEANARYQTRDRGMLLIVTFGPHMHALFARAKREGVRMSRETW